MEQLGRPDEAISLYETAIQGGFDSTGPYDRLIFLYSERAQHRDVIRVADSALRNVRTYEDKRAWYAQMKEEAKKASTKIPKAIPKSQ